MTEEMYCKNCGELTAHRVKVYNDNTGFIRETYRCVRCLKPNESKITHSYGEGFCDRCGKVTGYNIDYTDNPDGITTCRSCGNCRSKKHRR